MIAAKMICNVEEGTYQHGEISENFKMKGNKIRWECEPSSPMHRYLTHNALYLEARDHQCMYDCEELELEEVTISLKAWTQKFGVAPTGIHIAFMHPSIGQKMHPECIWEYNIMYHIHV